MALSGVIKSASVVGTPKPGDALKLRVVYDVKATENEAPWTIAVAAFDGTTLIGWDNTTEWVYNTLTNWPVEFTCSIKMPSAPKTIGLELYAHPDSGKKIEEYL